MMTVDYRQMTDDQIRSLVAERAESDLRAEITLEDLDRCAGRTAIERFEHGFGLILDPDTPAQLLWVLWIDPEHRGRKLGRAYARWIFRRYDEYFFTLVCHADRRRFWSSVGMRVVETHGESRTMRGPGWTP